MHHILSTLLLVFASCGGAQAEPSVSISFNAVLYFNSTPVARPGVDLYPSCVATGFPAGASVTFEWRFNGTSSFSPTPVLAVGGSATGSFLIAAPSKKDAGWYTCVASGQGGGGDVLVQTSGYLSVAYQEVLPTAPNTFEVREGQSLTLVCPTASFPPATFYTWSRESTPSSSSSPTLSEGSSPVYDIVNASLTNAGVYVCRSTNNYASTIDATLRVFVLAPPVIQKVNTTFVTIGNALQLNCTADSVHLPSYSWRSGNQSIANTSRVTVSVGGSGSGQLLVRQVVYNDSGVYTCVATNSIGRDTADFPVVVQGQNQIEISQSICGRGEGGMGYELVPARAEGGMGHGLVPARAEGGMGHGLVPARAEGGMGYGLVPARAKVEWVMGWYQPEPRVEWVMGWYQPEPRVEWVMGWYQPELRVEWVLGGGVVITPEDSTPSLVCSWIAYPTPSVTWTMTGGGGVSTGGRYSSPSVGTLVIGQVGGADEGTYLCSFSNALGNGTGSIQLVVIDKPTGLVVSNVGGHSLELQWNAIMSRTRVDQYVLEYGAQDNPSSKNVTFPGNSTTGKVWGLSAGSTYLLRLKAVKLGVAGTPGNQIMATTTTTAPVLALVSINPLDDGRSLQVRWHISDTGGVSIQAVNVTVLLNGSVVQTLMAQPSWGESCLVSGLMPATSYTIEVAASNAVGVTSVASSIITPLAPPATPTKPSIVAETSHSISMKTFIDSIGSAPVQFILINVSELHSGQSQVINASINDSSVVQYSSDVTTTSLGISLLIDDVGGVVKPNTLYVFSIAARNNVGASRFSEPTDPTSLVSPGYSGLYYIVAGVIGGVVAIAILLAAAVLLYTRTANCRRGKRISINPHNSDSPLKVSSGYVSSQDTEKPETSFLSRKGSIPASECAPSVNWSDNTSQTPCDPRRGIPSPLNLPGEGTRSRCDSRRGIPSPLNLTLASHRDLPGGILSPHKILSGGPSDLHEGVCSPTDLHFGVRSPNDFCLGSPTDFHRDALGVPRSLQNQLKSPPGYPLDPQRSVTYKFPPAHCSSPVSEAQSSPLECLSDLKHMADDVDSLSSPPTSLVQGPRPSFRKLPPADKRSESSDRSDGKISTFPGLEIDVPCGLPFSVSMKDSLFELDSIDIPKTSYMTDV
ncbi:hypothetical protein EMCRGX_G011901 [Ephydatia muelleri]